MSILVIKVKRIYRSNKIIFLLLEILMIFLFELFHLKIISTIYSHSIVLGGFDEMS